MNKENVRMMGVCLAPIGILSSLAIAVQTGSAIAILSLMGSVAIFASALLAE